jgi:hypothetical protein
MRKILLISVFLFFQTYFSYALDCVETNEKYEVLRGQVETIMDKWKSASNVDPNKARFGKELLILLSQ